MNQKYLAMISEFLGDVDAKRALNTCYLQLSYPEVFPDPDDATGIYGSFMDSSVPTDELKQACQQSWDKYRHDVDLVNTETCRLFDRAMEDMARYQGITDHAAVHDQPPVPSFEAPGTS